MKRIIDLVAAFIGLLLILPIMILTALLIRINMGKPVIFKQQRPGLNGKPFYLYKFRTMTDKKDSIGELLPDEERLTSFGKFLRRYSIDELPQLFNVVKGDMSFVGPRPLLMEYLPLYTSEQARRHEVRPGITGWVQVNGRNTITWEEKFKLDVWYVNNRSLFLDLKILLLTAIIVFKSEGINQAGHATMPVFKGNRNDVND